MTIQPIFYEMSLDELKKHLFHKKYCPNCLTLLVSEKHDRSGTCKDLIYKPERGGLIKPAKHYYFTYRCQNCESEYTIDDLFPPADAKRR